MRNVSLERMFVRNLFDNFVMVHLREELNGNFTVDKFVALGHWVGLINLLHWLAYDILYLLLKLLFLTESTQCFRFVLGGVVLMLINLLHCFTINLNIITMIY